MSLPSPERDDGAVSMEDSDHLDLPPDGDAPSSDEETIKGEREQDQIHDEIADIIEEERKGIISDEPAENGVVANRYRQLLRDRDDASEDGSAEGIPRRAGSPIDSLLSIPDDSPSLQVSYHLNLKGV